MIKKITEQKGFTLIEMLVAMSIFVMFIGVLMGSYTSIVKAQREANDYRSLYSEARRVFDKITEEVRDNAVYYGDSVNISFNSSSDVLRLISSDGTVWSGFAYKNNNVYFVEQRGADFKSYSLISDDKDGRLYVSEFDVFVSPAGDPYLNVYADSLQFQPKVTVFARFVLEKRSGDDPYFLDLQTTISSRFYAPNPLVLDPSFNPLNFINE
jgi:prepilin-type N-terminal cleavage/methylation domain-containing protein